jgi:hypothetical protein
MSKDICIVCKEVVSTTADQNLVRIIKESDLDEFDSRALNYEFIESVTYAYREITKQVCICDKCYEGVVA